MRATLLLVFFALGCRTQAPPADPSSPESMPRPPSSLPKTEEAEPPDVATEVNTKESPVMRCGPKDSYHFVANVFVCKDGSNPFKGNLGAAHDSRIGNVGANSTGHIINLYEVPCPEGPRRVYVDMYGCKNDAPGPGGASM